MANTGHSFDESLFRKAKAIDRETVDSAISIVKEAAIKLTANEKIQQLIRSVQMMDLTSLVGGETQGEIEQLCLKSLSPLNPDLVSCLEAEGHLPASGTMTTAAVCVYADCVPFAKGYFLKHEASSGVRPAIATVAGFPSGSTSIADKLKETKEAASAGADEIDIVIDKSQAINGKWQQLYEEMQQVKQLCDEMSLKLKVILKTGELGSMDIIYRASLACMLAGADFIKTSTGKEQVNATLETGIVMTTAIADYSKMTGFKVGFKPAGGIKTASDALQWCSLIQHQLGNVWLSPLLFRFGASSLLHSLEQELLLQTSIKQ